MKNTKRKLVLRGLSLFLAALITLTSVDVSAFAAPDTKSNNEITYSQLSDELENQVQEAYKALTKAYKSNNPADFIKACKLIAKLTPTQSVRLFVLKYKDYYKQNYLNDNFAYFNVEKYLISHPELIDQTRSVKYNKEKALEHYLEYGIYKGDSSCTDFDPVVAIIVQPQACIQAIVNDKVISNAGLDSIHTAYTVAEGTDNTLAYDLSSSFDDTNEDGKFKADEGILFIGKKNEAAASPVNEAPVSEITSTNPIVDDGAAQDKDIPSSDDSLRDPFLDGGMGGPNDYEHLINNKARKNITGFDLYRTPYSISSADNFSEYLEENDSLSPLSLNTNKYKITYFADNYKNIVNANSDEVDYSKVKDSTKYTVMLYLCGTDLESGNEGGVSNLIANLLSSQYDLNKVNVLVCVGGTNNYKAETLKENDGVKCSIYYLDPSKVDSKVLTNKYSDTADDKLKRENDFIKEDSLVKLTEIDSVIEMGQSELLLGFMDMAYELFPADNYWLSLWNHGGGAKSGICFGDKVENNSETTSQGLSLGRIEEALASSKLYSDNKKLAIMSFDACMMGGVEEAYNLSRYADYMVGSPEISMGDIGYNKAISYINSLGDEALVDNAKAAKLVVEGYMDNRAGDEIIYPSTDSAYDLSKAEKLANKTNDLALCLEALLRDKNSSNEAYRLIRKASVRAKSYGGDNDNTTTGYLDYYDFLTNLQAYLTELKYAQGTTAVTISTCNDALKNIDDIVNLKFILSSGYVYNANSNLTSGEGLYSIKDIALKGKANASNAYNKEFEQYISGISIYFPVGDNSYQYKAGYNYEGKKSEDESKINYLDEQVLHHYAYMIKYANGIANSDAEIKRLGKVAKALVSNENTSKNEMIDSLSFKTYDTGRKDVITNENIKNDVLTIKFNKDYAGTSYENDADHIDPFTDFMDVVRDIKLAVTKNTTVYQLDGEKNHINETNYDILIGEKKVYTSLGASGDVTYTADGLNDNPELSYNLSITSILGYFVEGIAGYFDYENKIYKTLLDDDSKTEDWALRQEADSDIDYSKLGEGYTSDNVYVFNGKYYYTTEDGNSDSKNGVLVFGNTETYGKLKYLNTYDKETEKWVDDNAKAISFNHYAVIDGKVYDLDYYVEAQNENITDSNAQKYINTPIYLIDSSKNNLTITQSGLVDRGVYEKNSKVVVEIEAFVPNKEGTGYEEAKVFYDGENKIYLGTTGDNPEASYKKSEAIGNLATDDVTPASIEPEPIAAAKNKALEDTEEGNVSEENISEEENISDEGNATDDENVADEENISDEGNATDDENVADEDLFDGANENLQDDIAEDESVKGSEMSALGGELDNPDAAILNDDDIMLMMSRRNL